jgi:hypothetical protein
MFQMYVASVLCGYCKVDWDVAYVAMVVHVCCKLLFSMLHLFFQTYVASVFIWMLHMFHTYVASVLSRCCVCFIMVFKCSSGAFASVSDACFKYFIYLGRTLQVLYLDVLKVDRVLHLRPYFLLSRLGVSSSRRRLGIRCPSPLLDAGDTFGAVRETYCKRGCPDVLLVWTSHR